jgi:hypothetical protein
MGIKDGVPDKENGGDDIRLGDIIISKSINTFSGVI